MDLVFSQALGPVKFALISITARAEEYILHSNKVPSCKKGCAGCCNRVAPVLVAEAVLIYEYLKSKKSWPAVRERAREQFPLLKDDPHPIAWFKMGKPCPVLDPETKSCLAHSIRPIVCATHYVLSSPVTCEPWGITNKVYQPLDYPDLCTEFRTQVFNNVAGFGILSIELPLPTALLLAERISVQSGIDLSQAVSLILNEL